MEVAATCIMMNQDKDYNPRQFHHFGRGLVEDYTLTGRLFQVTDTRSGRRCIFKFELYSDFEQRCKDKFGYQQNMDVIFELEGEQVEVDEFAFELLAHNAKLNIRTVEGRRAEEYGTHTERYFKVTDEQSGRKCAIEYLDFKQRCKEEFGYRKDEYAKFELEDDQRELGVSDLEVLANNTSLKIKKVHGVEYIKQLMKNNDKENLKAFIEEADKMSVAPLAIAVIGRSGQGKSSLINTLRNLHPGDEGYAETGVIETTMECRAYQHPLHPNLVFWDVPGVGTTKYPRETYTTAIKLDRYDFFLICSSTRFTEDDTWLLHEVQIRKKKCYFLRTNVDIDLEKSQRNKGTKFNERDQLGEIRTYCHKNIPTTCKLFLISCIDKTKFDFPALYANLLHDAPIEQQRSLTFCLESVSTDMIEQKATYLKNDIWKFAALSALFGTVPIPGLSICVDLVLVKIKIKYYQREFELTDADIARYSQRMNLSVSAFKTQAGLKLDFDLFESRGIICLLKRTALEFAAEEAARFIPSVGWAIGACLSYRTTKNVLETILNDCKEDAISVLTSVTAKK